jgi:hypothetical protein
MRTVLENPWANLHLGLALGGKAMIERVRELLEKRFGGEEVQWVTRTEEGEKRLAAARLLEAGQSERCWQVWVRVCLGAERRIDVARAYGYANGSAINQILNRLEARTRTDRALPGEMSRLRRKFEQVLSSV